MNTPGLMKGFFLLTFLITVNFHVMSQVPPWLKKRPYSDDVFYGIGRGNSREIAERNAKYEIVFQISSQVNAVVQIQTANIGNMVAATEKVSGYIESGNLKTAVTKGHYVESGRHAVLVEYPGKCGMTMVENAVKRYEPELGIDDLESLLSVLQDGILMQAIHYNNIMRDAGDDKRLIVLAFSNENKTIQIVNFDGFGDRPAEKQLAGLEALAIALSQDLRDRYYRPVNVLGHANTAIREEDIPLEYERSQRRANIMAQILRAAGIRVGLVRGVGSTDKLGHQSTAFGRALNRRVDIDFGNVEWNIQP